MLLLYLKLWTFYIYAKSHCKYHTFEGYYTCSFCSSKLRHKVHQKVWKCSLSFPLQNSYFLWKLHEYYVTVDNLGGGTMGVRMGEQGGAFAPPWILRIFYHPWRWWEISLWGVRWHRSCLEPLRSSVYINIREGLRTIIIKCSSSKPTNRTVYAYSVNIS